MKVSVISLGCDKNRVDSEYMMGLLADAGHTFTEREEEAEAIIVNSCCFIGDAQEESIETLLTLGALKQQGTLKRLVVAGCLAERFSKEIAEQIPEVDAILGTASFEDIVAAVEAEGLFLSKRELTYLPAPKTKRVIPFGNFVSYLKIAEGCDKHCTYCVIPGVRGPYRSYPMERLLEEAKYLAANGTKELVIVAQETTLYGLDLYGQKKLPELLQALCAVEGIEWIRLLYCYPEEITPELVAVMKQEKKLCKYLDLPIQHASDRILRLMGRRTTRAEITEKIAYLRREIPEIVLRTSLICGFPQEMAEDVDALIDFLREVRLERVGAFTYSKEEGTAAAKMKPQIAKREKEARRRRVMLAQQEISAELGAKRIGETLPVMVEGYLPEEDVYIGRTAYDAPNIDGNVFFTAGRSMLSGEIVDVVITDSKEYDLIGEVFEDEFAE